MGKLTDLSKSADKALDEMEKYKKEAKEAKKPEERQKLIKQAEAARQIAASFLKQIEIERAARAQHVLNVINQI